MSLVFGAATSDRVDCGSGATLDDVQTVTHLLWVFPTTLTTNKVLVSKAAVGNNALRLNSGGGNVEFRMARATTSLSFITNTTPLSALNTWAFLAVTADIGGSACHIYKGLRTALAAEAGYGTSTIGSGTYTSDAAENYRYGNNGGLTAAFQGSIGTAAVFNRVLSLGEIQSWQFNPRMMAGCVGFWKLGAYGAGTGADVHKDSSGNGNHGTLTGATQGLMVPLRLANRSLIA